MLFLKSYSIKISLNYAFNYNGLQVTTNLKLILSETNIYFNVFVERERRSLP